MSNLLAKPAYRPLPDELEQVDNKGITLRLNPSLRHYLDQRAEQLGGMPVSTLISTILSGVQQSDQRRVYSDNGRFFDDVRTIADRIRYLFDHHDYTPLQVTQALQQFGITPKVLIDDAELVERVTPETATALADAFGIQENWLVSRSADTSRPCERAHLRHGAKGVLASVLKWDEHGVLDGIHPICRSSDLKGHAILHESDGNGPYVGLLVRLRPGVSGFFHDKFVAWDAIPFGYSAARLEYKALIFELYRRFSDGAKFQGLKLDDDLFETVTEGAALVPHDLNSTARNVWDVEHYVGSTWAGPDSALESDELVAVKEEAKRLFGERH